MRQYLLLQGLRAGLVEARSLPWPVTVLERRVLIIRRATTLATTTDPDGSEVHVGWSTQHEPTKDGWKEVTVLSTQS